MGHKQDFFPDADRATKRFMEQALNAASDAKVNSATFGIINRRRLDDQQVANQHRSYFRDEYLIPAVNSIFHEVQNGSRETLEQMLGELKGTISEYVHACLFGEVSPDYEEPIGLQLKKVTDEYAEKLLTKIQEKVPGQGAARSAA